MAPLSFTIRYVYFRTPKMPTFRFVHQGVRFCGIPGRPAIIVSLEASRRFIPIGWLKRRLPESTELYIQTGTIPGARTAGIWLTGSYFNQMLAIVQAKAASDEPIVTGTLDTIKTILRPYVNLL